MNLAFEMPKEVAAILLVEASEEVHTSDARLILYRKHFSNKNTENKIIFEDFVLQKFEKGSCRFHCSPDKTVFITGKDIALFKDYSCDWYTRQPEFSQSIIFIWRYDCAKCSLKASVIDDAAYVMKGLRMALLK